jgi:hypothetical protein
VLGQADLLGPLPGFVVPLAARPPAELPGPARADGHGEAPGAPAATSLDRVRSHDETVPSARETWQDRPMGLFRTKRNDDFEALSIRGDDAD